MMWCFGESQGEYSDEVGELEELLTVCDWIKHNTIAKNNYTAYHLLVL